MIWLVVFEKITTLQELETHWSLDDLVRANAVLEMRSDYLKETEKARKADDNRKSTANRNRV